VLFYASVNELNGFGHNQVVSTKLFVVNYMQGIRSIDISEFLNILEDEYNLKLDKYKLVSDIKDTNLYYDRIMEKLYVDYETYFEEI
jgi:hypothetical protein